MNVLKKEKSINYTKIIFMIWSVSLLILGFLQFVGAPFGFKVWALGEDRTWLGIILSNDMMHSWWTTHGRNPLSPWWWALVSPLLSFSDWSLYLIRKCCDPILAVSTFLLLDQLGRKKYRAFSFSVALIVLFWNFSQYHESVLWDMLIALSFTLLTLFFYCRYVDSNRSNGNDIALAILCYLITLSTYTIQSGAIIGIAALAFYRKPTEMPFSTREKWKNTCKDTAYFLTIFILYSCIWYTVNTSSQVDYAPKLNLFMTQIASSILQFLFHPSYTTLFMRMWNTWSFSSILFTSFTAFIAIYYMLFKLFQNKANDNSDQTSIPIGWLSIVLLSICLPTILLESVSSMWVPGTRSLMTQQVWQPLLYVSIIFLTSHYLFRRFKNKNLFAFAGVALLGAIVILIGLDYNYHLVLRTTYQRNLVNGIRDLKIPNKIHPAFIIKTNNLVDEDLNSISLPITTFSQTVFKHNDATIRVLVATPSNDFEPYWKVKLDEDTIGATNAKTLGDTRVTPYSSLWIVFFDGKKVNIPDKIDKKNLEGLQVIWNRKTFINQRLNHSKINFM